jgi:small conductance mechanosensitive channel
MGNQIPESEGIIGIMRSQGMENQVDKLERIRDVMMLHGVELILSVAILVIGIIAVRWVNKILRHNLTRLKANPTVVSIICNIIYVLMLVAVVSVAAVEAGIQIKPVARLFILFSLIVVGVIVIFRPFLPSLPFKVGNTVKIGDLLGKIEATTILNTRLRTFDGKTFFVPNRQILNDIVINYHYSKTRRIKINVGIRYDQDLMKAKQVLESVMIEDPRVKAKPSPVVYVLNLTNNCVELGGRCWVDNMKFWTTRCDLIEKTKFRFDHEGIVIAFPQLDLHHYNKSNPTNCTDHSRLQDQRLAFESTMEEDEIG